MKWFNNRNKLKVIFPDESDSEYNLYNVHYNLGWDVNYRSLSRTELDKLLSHLKPVVGTVTVTCLDTEQLRLRKADSKARYLLDLMSIERLLEDAVRLLVPNVINETIYITDSTYDPAVILSFNVAVCKYLILTHYGELKLWNGVRLGEKPSTLHNKISQLVRELDGIECPEDGDYPYLKAYCNA